MSNTPEERWVESPYASKKRKIVKDFKTKGDGFERTLICEVYSTDTYWNKKTILSYEVEGWWGRPINLRLEEGNNRQLTVEIHTSSGGQHVDKSLHGLDKVRNLIAVLKDAEEEILEAQRNVGTYA